MKMCIAEGIIVMHEGSFRKKFAFMNDRVSSKLLPLVLIQRQFFMQGVATEITRFAEA